ncbi:MAG: trans-sulfuration enzyme family protein [Gammaproteobacteria bacterium]
MNANTEPDFFTRCIHGGQSPDPATGAVMPPISLASTYAQKSPGVNKGYAYSRTANPTRQAWERAVASLEGGVAAWAFASGVAAVAAAVELLPAGSRVIVQDDLYWGVLRLFKLVREETANIRLTAVDLGNPNTLADAMTPDTRMVWVETPSNPMMKLVDLEAVARIAHSVDALSVVDSTFASPYCQRPLELGVDIVMHSATKYLNGHSDVVGGVLATRREDLCERLNLLQYAVGAVASPFDSYMALRGLKTLGVRLERQCASAQAIAERLEGHPKIRRVFYPGLPSHPQHELARRQMVGGFGGMLSADIDTDLTGARRFLESLTLFTLAESLGGVESLIEHPGLMTHAALPVDERRRQGIGDGLARISVGIEKADDLIADLESALECV